MKVLLRRRIRKLGTIGDIVEVKPGYARNYLLPQNKAVLATPENRRMLEKAKYLAELAKEKEELQVRADFLSGKEITITSRANDSGHLYGSIGPAQIAYAMNEMDLPVLPDEVILPEPIRQLDKYDITIELDDDVTATMHVWVVPVREDGDEDTPYYNPASTEVAVNLGAPSQEAIDHMQSYQEAPPAPEEIPAYDNDDASDDGAPEDIESPEATDSE